MIGTVRWWPLFADVSVGTVDGKERLDLDSIDGSRPDVDMNAVCTDEIATRRDHGSVHTLISEFATKVRPSGKALNGRCPLTTIYFIIVCCD